MLVFDGDCGFCTTTANLIVRRSSAPIEAVAWQLTDVTALGLTEKETAARVWFVAGGEAFGGHLAIAQIFMLQRNWLWKALGWLMTVPQFCWLASIGYALVARYRHRLPGGTPACLTAKNVRKGRI